MTILTFIDTIGFKLIGLALILTGQVVEGAIVIVADLIGRHFDA